MPVALAHAVVVLAGVYLAVGVAFAVLFVSRWVGRVDPAARSGTPGFRLIIAPGTVLLWPLLLRRLVKGIAEPPEENNAHRSAARRTAHR